MPARPTGSPLRGRLKTRAEFLRASAEGRKVATPGLVLQRFARADDDPVIRVGFTVTRKVGNAVVRNRVKRRLREAARLVLGDTGSGRADLRSVDLVLIGRDGTRRRRFDALCRDLLSALDRAAPGGARR